MRVSRSNLLQRYRPEPWHVDSRWQVLFLAAFLTQPLVPGIFAAGWTKRGSAQFGGSFTMATNPMESIDTEHFSALTIGKRPHDGQRKLFKDALKQSFRRAGVTIPEWEALTQNRSIWRPFICSTMCVFERQRNFYDKDRRRRRKKQGNVEIKSRQVVGRRKLLNSESS